MNNGSTEVTLGGKTYKVHLPQSFADREDIVSSWHDAKTTAKTRRVFGATLALCVPEVAALAKGHSLDSHDGNLGSYGKVVYDAVRGAGADFDAVHKAAKACLDLIFASLFPRKPDVEKVEDFSGGGAGPT